MTYRELLRLRALEDICCRMSDDDVQELRQLASSRELLESLRRQEAKIDDISRRVGSHPFASDLLANVAGNAITEGALLVLRRLLR